MKILFLSPFFHNYPPPNIDACTIVSCQPMIYLQGNMLGRLNTWWAKTVPYSLIHLCGSYVLLKQSLNTFCLHHIYFASGLVRMGFILSYFLLPCPGIQSQVQFVTGIWGFPVWLSSLLWGLFSYQQRDPDLQSAWCLCKGAKVVTSHGWVAGPSSPSRDGEGKR